MTIRLRVAELRGAKGWTQQELATAAGVSRATVMRVESAERPPTRLDFDVLEKLADALGIEPGFLIVRIGPRKRRAAR